MILGKTFYFDAAHQLPQEEIYGACSSRHGHTYKLRVEIEGGINEHGWVCNFKEIKEIVRKHIVERYDHSDLNLLFEVPTAENMLIEIMTILTDVLPKGVRLYSLKLWETKDSYAKIICK